MRVASIDIGTNSSRLLIIENNNDNFKVLSKTLITTRLGEGVDRNRILKKTAINKLLSALKVFKTEINKYNVNEVEVVGTSALRDVNNSKKLVKFIKKELGFDLKIIDGLKEAQLTYKGVSTDLPFEKFMIFDIGGGSTEFIWKKDKDDFNFISLNLGAVRMTERFLKNPENKIGKYESNDIQYAISEILKKYFGENIAGNYQAVGVGGTITTLGAIDLKLEKYNSKKIHHYRLKYNKINEILYKLKNVNIEERKKFIGLQPERADIIVAGTIILKRIMDFFEFKEILISENDILWGMIENVI